MGGKNPKSGKKIIRNAAKPFVDSIRLDASGHLHIKLYNHWGLAVIESYGGPDTHVVLEPMYEGDVVGEIPEVERWQGVSDVQA